MDCRLLLRGVGSALFLAAALGVQARAEGVELVPGAIVDDDRGRILVMQPGSGIAVLDLTDGDVLCTTRHAARPLLVRGSRVLAQTESGGSKLRLYIFELEESAEWSGDACRLVPLREVSIALPTHIVTAIDERIDSAFDVRAWAETEPGAWLEWSYRESPAYPQSRAEKGVVYVDLSTGSVTQAGPAKTTPRRSSLALSPVASSVPQELRVADDLVSITVSGRTDGSKSVRLERRSMTTGARSRSMDLAVDDVRALRLASDDRSLMVSGFVPGAAPGERYRWSIFALDSGRKRGEIRAGRSGSPFWVGEDLVIFREDRTAQPSRGAEVERPVRLVAQSLSDEGAVIWSYRIRDTAYRGVRAPKQPHGNLKNYEIEAAR